MNHTTIEIAMKAMNHPRGWEILQAIERLTHTNSDIDSSSQLKSVKSVNTRAKSVETFVSAPQLPRWMELQRQGVDVSNSDLLKIAKQHPERLTTAIDAWLGWASYTEVGSPTLSLIKAIEEDWKP